MIFCGDPVVLPYNEMLLSVGHAKNKVLDGFLSFWGWHVTGFNDTKHCQPCFVGERERAIQNKMRITKAGTPLIIPVKGNYFYICGVTDFKVFTHKEYMKNNFHFPLRWKPGSFATMTTYNEYTFVVENAEIVQFNGAFAKKKYYHLGYPFWSCRNFQFAADMYVKDLESDTKD